MKKINNIGYLALLLLLVFTGCRKTDFGTVESPAYIRVFNNLDRQVTLDNKDAPQPFLTMLIDPVLDEKGIPQSAATVGDFLDTRDSWARPYPDAANTTVYQKEYPGANKVMAAPILNGYDLSSWAQIPSGQHRIMFFSRPLNTTPFFNLAASIRGTVLVDTTINLTHQEVYTMHVLEQDYATRKSMLYVRNETFIKQSLSDSMVYVNFYNLSSKNFFEQSPNTIAGGLRQRKLVDTISVFTTLKKAINNATEAITSINGYAEMPMGTIIRSQEPKVAPYHSFPLYPDTSSNRIYPGITGHVFEFLHPNFVLGTSRPIGGTDLPVGYYWALTVGPAGTGLRGLDFSTNVRCDIRSGLIVTERSGIYNPRYFPTVNTIEYVNAKLFITTIQRRFDPPIY